MKSQEFAGKRIKIAFSTFPGVSQGDEFSLFFLALFAGLYVLFGLISVYLSGGIIEKEETKIFVLGWVLAPVCAILSVPLFVWVRQKFLSEMADSLWALLATNSLLFGLLTTVINLSWQWKKSVALTDNLAYAALLVVPLVNLAVILALKHTRFRIPPGLCKGLIIAGSIGVLNFIGLFPYYNGTYSTPLFTVILSILIGAGALLITKNWRIIFHSRLLLVGIDLLVILLTVLACFDPAFFIDQHHANFYLGPANRLLHGGTMLVDTFSQYGVLVIYFLAWLVKARLIPFTYQGLSFAMAVLFMIQSSLLYLLLVVLVKNRFYAILLLILSLLLGVFGTIGIIQAYPSTGPLRFGLAYLVLGIVYLRRRFDKLRWMGITAEYLVVGMAFLWSFETFIYTAFAYLGVCLFDSFRKPAGFSQSLIHFIRRAGWMLVAVAAVDGVFSAATFLRAGKWPEWGTYLDYFKAYSVDGFGSMLVPTWSPWIFPVAISFVSLMAFLFRYLYLKKIDDSPAAEFIFGLTLAGIAIYTYFLGRSHPNNLFHISIPSVVIAGYWFVELAQKGSIPESMRWAGRFAFFTAAALVILALYPSFETKAKQDHTGYRLVAKSIYAVIKGHNPNVWDVEKSKILAGSPNPQVGEAVQLIRKYTPGQKDVVIFLSAPNTTTEALISAGRNHRFPINDVVADSLSQIVMDRVLTYPHGLRPNDIIFLAYDPLAYQRKENVQFNGLQIQLITRLCQEFSFQEIEHTSNGVLAVKLQQNDGKPSQYCEKIKSIEPIRLIQ